MIPALAEGRVQTPILTVTLNPALDLASATDKVEPGPKLRCDDPITDPGGGGINVSRAIARMGGHSTALVALGGANGDQIAQLLTGEGLAMIRLAAPGPTRLSVAITDRASGAQYRFVMPGPQWEPIDTAAALEAIAGSIPSGGIVVLSGSNPPGVPDDFAARLSAALTARGAGLFVDTSGEQLAAVAAGRHAPVALLRMDEAEAEGLAGAPLPGRPDTADFAQRLVDSGAAFAAIVARGADGNIIATRRGRWHVPAHDVPIISKVGAGDSFVAGFSLAIARGLRAPAAMALGAAAASAACMTPATELCRPEDVAALYDADAVTEI